MLTFEFIDPEEQLGSEDFQFVEGFLTANGRTQIGWHYITDLTWIYRRVKHWPRESRVLDAGGGGGPLQFLLADLGFHVTNIDMVLPKPAPVDAKRYRLTARRLHTFAETRYASHLREQWATGGGSTPARAYRALRGVLGGVRAQLRAVRQRATSPGTIEWVTGNLCDLSEIASDTFDAVVSLSALEHVPIDELDTALGEIARVAKSDASWAVTTSGTEQAATWLHEPSQGWCFSISDLEDRFGAVAVRAQDPDEMLGRYRNCSYLREHLAGFYLRTGQSGMPWGVWDPKYVPVGLTRG